MGTPRQHHREKTVASGVARPAACRGAVSASTIGTVVLATFMACFWAGCEIKVTKQNYSKLSYWFDGVPDPNAPVGSPQSFGKKGTTRPAQQQIVSRHKPYVEQKCGECHTTGGTQPDFALAAASCVRCHDKVLKQYPVMHGPVVSGACLWCHTPHESAMPLLLRAESAQLCTQCHDRRVLSPETADHQAEKKGCLECHTGHGGTDRRMLKAPGTSPGPATRPSPVPAIGPTAATEKGGL